jgi:hypothetical protein
VVNALLLVKKNTYDVFFVQFALEKESGGTLLPLILSIFFVIFFKMS